MGNDDDDRRGRFTTTTTTITEGRHGASNVGVDDNNDDDNNDNCDIAPSPPTLEQKSLLQRDVPEPPQTEILPVEEPRGAHTSPGCMGLAGPGGGQRPPSEIGIDSRLAAIARQEFGGATEVQIGPVLVVRESLASPVLLRLGNPQCDGKAGSTLAGVDFSNSQFAVNLPR